LKAWLTQVELNSGWIERLMDLYCEMKDHEVQLRLNWQKVKVNEIKEMY
jgi:hypothetical protein